MKEIFSSKYRPLFIISLLIYLCTAFFSEGYHHPDEHFQIFEFCNYKLGNSPAADLPWEFKDQIRPTLQPTLTFVIFSILKIIGLTNPFSLAFIMRVVSAFFSWYLISLLILLLQTNFNSEKGKKYFIYLSLFLWFIPYCGVRFSSENWGGLLFLTALYLILKYQGIEKKIIPFIVAGLLLGFSFAFRFQMAFAIIGLGLWLLFIQKINFKNILALVVPTVISVVLFLLVDFWFYGKPTLTTVNYFVANIIQNKAAGWGTEPFWFYFTDFILQGIPPISIVLLILFFIGLFKSRKSIFTWTLIPFLLVHMLTAHKELRFMFPMIFAFIYLAALGLDSLIEKQKIKKVWNFMMVFCIWINMPLLVIKMFSPAQEGVKYFHFLYNFTAQKKITLLCDETEIYNVVDLNANFYRSPNVKCIVFKNKNEIPQYLNTQQPDSIFILERRLGDNLKFTGYSKIKQYSFFWDWVLSYNLNDWQSRARIWTIYKLKREN